MFHRTEKRILVTGGASGIGLATAKRFLDLNAKVAVLDVNEKALNDLSSHYKNVEGQLICVQGDVRVQKDIDLVLEEMKECWGGIDVLINSAGILPDCLIIDMSEDEWDRVMDINVKGTFLTCQKAARQMILQGYGGHIVTISSGSYRFGRVGSGHYCASKAAIVMLTRVMAMEFAKYDIFVNSIAPGLIDNPILSEQYKEEFTKRIPFGRIGQPDDISAAIELLVSSNNTFISGQVISVDGGLTAGHYGLSFSNAAGNKVKTGSDNSEG